MVAILTGGLLMILLADRVTEFLTRNRMYEVLGLFILFVVGILLVSEGGHLAKLKLAGHEIHAMSKATFYSCDFRSRTHRGGAKPLQEKASATETNPSHFIILRAVIIVLMMAGASRLFAAVGSIGGYEIHRHRRLVGNAIFLRGEKFLYCLAEDGDRADLGAFGFFNSTRSGRFHAVTQRVALRSKPIFSTMRSSKSGRCAAP